MSNRRLLVVSLEFPYPLKSGGTRDIHSRLKAMYDAGYKIDLVSTVRDLPSDDDVEAIRPLVESIQIVHRTRRLRDLLCLQPFLVSTRSGLKTITLGREYLAVILETEHVGKILDNLTLRARHRILRVHNCESNLYRCFADCTATTKEKCLFWLESVKLRFYFPNVMRKCDMAWYISSAEMDRLEAPAVGDGSAGNAFLVRSLVDAASFRKRSLVGATALYAGALSVPTNYRGLIWYLKNVHPSLLSIPDYKFVLIGQRGRGNLRALIEAINASERVAFLPDVENLEEYFAGAAVFINPIQSGAGVKTKNYDATVEGMPVVTTSPGAEGTGFINGVHTIVADSAELFVEGLKRVIGDKQFAQQLVENAQNELKSHNHPGFMLDILDSLT